MGNNNIMDDLQSAADTYNKLIGNKIKLVLGKKGNKKEIYIDFSIEDFYHLTGLHHLKDLRSISRLSSKIAFNEIRNNHITLDKIKKSKYFNTIKDRIKCVKLLLNIFSDPNVVFKFNKKARNFGNIKWQYLLMFNTSNPMYNGYLFLQEIRKKTNHFVCVSIFENTGYECNHVRYTLLESSLISNNKETKLYKRTKNY